MNALIVTPAPEGSLVGNRRTAERWASVLARLGHGARVVEAWDGEGCDLMIALHAERSADSIVRFASHRPDAPLIVALTGTDLYGDLQRGGVTRRSLELASRVVALHHRAGQELDDGIRPKLRVVLQSAEPVAEAPDPVAQVFEVAVLGHLRPVKDPFRAAEAARRLPPESRVQVVHVGSALLPEMEERARREQEENSRYRWLGPLPREEALRVLAGSRLLVLSSLTEGGANVVGEAVVHGVPVVSSHIAGSVGLLGDDYPGYFPTGDTQALATLLRRCETDGGFLRDLASRCRALAPAFSPEKEAEAWRRLLAELNVA